MERLTKRGKGICVGLSACFDECDHTISGCDCVRVRGAINRLAAYEDTGLAPDEIMSLREAAHSVNRQKIKLESERDTLKKALEKYQKTEQWLNDMNNPLEPIKVSAALDSEIMKLNYRKEHNPESISELDGTIISALLFIQQAQEQEGQK